MKTIRAYQLKVGDRFTYIPAQWFGVGVVTESYGTRILLPNEPIFDGEVSRNRKHRVSGTWTIKFANDKVVNPPGIEYCNPETKFRLLDPLKTEVPVRYRCAVGRDDGHWRPSTD